MRVMIEVLGFFLAFGILVTIVQRYGFKRGCLPIAAVSLIILGAVIVQGRQQKRALAKFGGQLAPFLADTALGQSAETPTYLGGRVLTLNPKSRSIHRLYFALPDSLRARVPSEVSTVVLVSHDTIVVGSYQPNGGPAFIHQWTLTVIDHSKQVVLGTMVVRGSNPPRSLPGNAAAGAGGSQPLQAAAHFLSALPDRR